MNADLNNANKTNRRRTVKTRSRFTTLLTVYFFVALIIPNCVLANTEPYSVWTVEALILMPLGFYMMWSVALRRSGVMIWLAFPFIFFCAFQIVLLYLLDLHGGGRNARIERFTLGCQRNAAVRADKKHAVQLIFQFVHHVGDIGLVVAQHPCRLGKVLIFGDVVKNFVVFPIHVHRCAPVHVKFI